MAEMIDSEAREQISKLWGSHRELAADYWGPDKSNGRRSQIVAIEGRVDDLEDDQRSLRGDLRHYLDKEREETCVGKRLVEAHTKDHHACKEEETQVEVARINAGAAQAAARRQTIALIVGQILTLTGVVLSILLK